MFFEVLARAEKASTSDMKPLGFVSTPESSIQHQTTANALRLVVLVGHREIAATRGCGLPRSVRPTRDRTEDQRAEGADEDLQKQLLALAGGSTNKRPGA